MDHARQTLTKTGLCQIEGASHVDVQIPIHRTFDLPGQIDHHFTALQETIECCGVEDVPLNRLDMLKALQP